MSETTTTISNALRRAVEEAREKGEYTVLCSDALLMTIADRVEYLENEHSAALRAQENEPLTWNERINQMTAEEKAELIEKITTECPFAVGYTRKQSCDRYEDCCLCWTEWLKSPYEPTHAPDGGKE